MDATQKQIRTLMMIDDNAIDQMMYKRIVDRSGLVANLIQFTDAREALNHLLAKPDAHPDLILLDINMPGMDGFEFLDRASEELGTSMCPVIVMLTTSLNPHDEHRARNYDVVRDFLNKPLTQPLLGELSILAADLHDGAAAYGEVIKKPASVPRRTQLTSLWNPKTLIWGP